MAEMYELKEEEERVILIAVSTEDNDDTVHSVEELSELAATAGAVTVGTVIQTGRRSIRGPISVREKSTKSER